MIALIDTQKELDALPLDFEGTAVIRFGTRTHPARIRSGWKGHWWAVVEPNSVVVVKGQANLHICEGGIATVETNKGIALQGAGFVYLASNARVAALGSLRIEAKDGAQVTAFEKCEVHALDRSKECASNGRRTLGKARARERRIHTQPEAARACGSA